MPLSCLTPPRERVLGAPCTWVQNSPEAEFQRNLGQKKSPMERERDERSSSESDLRLTSSEENSPVRLTKSLGGRSLIGRELPLPATKRDKISDENETVIERLISRQRIHLPRAEAELQTFGHKSSHWAWWAFPTDKPGFSEPRPPTFVSIETAAQLVDQAPKEWRTVLELVTDLIEKHQNINKVLPRIDHGRVLFFLKFWRELEDTPVWLHDVIRRLEPFLASTDPSFISGAPLDAMRRSKPSKGGEEKNRGTKILLPARSAPTRAFSFPPKGGAKKKKSEDGTTPRTTYSNLPKSRW
uniref:Uncharacterized protein n=1 Tax=Aureoumbra lagunensis TaxID=44058 RepID=A0A7S3NNK0_9STRA|mmetsp:Transcript_12398/g.18615  ORF Transcript_12398/g.18615 Transcript_12398/m.18615 type:complete len:299 (-) Transcript_12398:164-1060(-)